MTETNGAAPVMVQIKDVYGIRADRVCGRHLLCSILNASLISISERQREIATFRVLGYKPREVGKIFLHESMIVNFIGGLFGFPMGYVLCLQTAQQFGSQFLRLPLYISSMSLILTVVLTVAFTLVAHFQVQRTIGKMNWLDALQIKE